MEADWEIEIGGGAPIIEALWSGFVDLRRAPAQIGELSEALEFPPLARFLAHVNGAASPLWSSKCDVWEPAADRGADLDRIEPTAVLDEPDGLEVEAQKTGVSAALACYVDLLPRQNLLFAQWEDAERFCRAWVERLESVDLADGQIDLIVRQAAAGQIEGFGITAYVSVVGSPPLTNAGQSWEQGLERERIGAALGSALEAMADSIPPLALPATGA
jgi:hypothetical protein